MLKNKTAFITGASRGIGRSVALCFAEHGAYVGINYLSQKKSAQETLDQIRDIGGNGILLKGDVSKMKDMEDNVQTLVKNRGDIDILVNNAGIYKRSTFNNITNDQWKKTLSVNLTGCYNCCKQVIPYMKSNSRIIFISSQLAFKGTNHGADYATSKAALLGLMRSLALELADKNILVNAIAPGTIDTDIIADYTLEMRKNRSDEIPLHRLGTPRDIANCCLFLASDLASYITGETIHVNGGLYIH